MLVNKIAFSQAATTYSLLKYLTFVSCNLRKQT